MNAATMSGYLRRSGIGRLIWGLLATVALVGLPGASQAQTPPRNDDFPGQVLPTNISGRFGGTTVDGTIQAGEPLIYSSDVGGHSVWFQWTAPQDGHYTFRTEGSTFDTLLGLFTSAVVSPTFGDLTPLAENDDYPATGSEASISFDALATHVYYIGVDGSGGASGTYTLSWNLPPANDQLSGRTSLFSNTSGSLSNERSFAATLEAGEPQILNNAGGSSIWYQWSPFTNGSTFFTTAGSDFDTRIAVYQSATFPPTMGSLALIAANDDDASVAPAKTSRVTFSTNSSTTYYIQIDGTDGASGAVRLAWGNPPPPNDDFENAQGIGSADTGNISGTTIGATRQTAEPLHAGLSTDHSVWYLWRPTTSVSVKFTAEGDSSAPVLAIYSAATPAALATLTPVASNWDFPAEASFLALSNTTYYIAVDGFSDGDDFTLSWAPVRIDLIPEYQFVLYKGGMAYFEVDTDPDVVWQATTTDPWIAIDPTTSFGVGPGTVIYTFGANAVQRRFGTIAVNNTAFYTVEQEPVRHEGELHEPRSGSPPNEYPGITDWIDEGFLLMGYEFPGDGVTLPAIPAGEAHFNFPAEVYRRFQLMDTIPATGGRIGQGDGIVTVTDWANIALYADAFDVAPVLEGMRQHNDYTTRIENTTIPKGPTPETSEGWVSITCRSLDDMRAQSFSISFDPDQLEFVDAVRGVGLNPPQDYTFTLQNPTSADEGCFGIQVGVRPGATFPEGPVEIARVKLRALPNALPRVEALTFSSCKINEVFWSFGSQNHIHPPTELEPATFFSDGFVEIVDTAQEPRRIRVQDVNIPPGESGDLDILLDSKGDENSLGFTLAYDPTKVNLDATTVEEGSDIPGEAAFIPLNRFNADLSDNLYPKDGLDRVQVLIGLQPGTTFAAGTRHLARFHLTAAPDASDETPIRFESFLGPYDEDFISKDAGHAGVTQKLADAKAYPQSAIWVDGTVGFRICSVAPSPASTNFAFQGGTGEFAINTTAGCLWSVHTDADWVTITSDTSGRGATPLISPITFTVARNEGDARSATIEIDGGTPFTITQDQATSPNDAFPGTTITGDSGTYEGYNRFAALESGEPAAVVGNPGGHSVWFNWVAPSNGTYSFRTENSNFDTLLGAFTSSTPSPSFGSLVRVASNDNYPSISSEAMVRFNATAGTTYYFVLDGSNNTYGSYRLHWTLPPANDKLAGRQVLLGEFGTVQGSSFGAALETGEPGVVGNPGGSSVWFEWLATSAGNIRIRTNGSEFDTILAIYSGVQDPVFDDLILVASNDNFPTDGSSVTSQVNFVAVEGTRYYFQLDGNLGLSGNYIIQWDHAIAPPPDNDDHENPRDLVGRSGITTGTNMGATVETFEDVFNPQGGTSVWFRWSAPEDGTYSFDTQGSTFGTILGVWRTTLEHPSWLDWVLIGDNYRISDDEQFSRVCFYAQRGWTYYITIEGAFSGVGEYVMNWQQADVTLFKPGSTTEPIELGDCNQFATFPGGEASFNVGLLKGCGWTAVADSEWILIDPAFGAGSGDGEVRYTIDASEQADPRYAVILVNGVPFTICQEAVRKEGMVTPGDRAVSGNVNATDWVDHGFMTLGADSMLQGVQLPILPDGDPCGVFATDEYRRFQAMDTIPATGGAFGQGDGVVSTADWVKTARFANQMDGTLDAEGIRKPTDYYVRISNGIIPIGATPATSVGTISIFGRNRPGARLQAFSIAYSDAQLEFVSATRGSALSSEQDYDFTLQNPGNGTFGIQVAGRAGHSLPATGNEEELARITFRAKTGATPRVEALKFGDAPVPRITDTCPLLGFTPDTNTPTYFFADGFVELVDTVGAAGAPRQVRIQDVNIPPGLEGDLNVVLDSKGDENAVGFAFSYDPTYMTIRMDDNPPGHGIYDITPGRDVPAEAAFLRVLRTPAEPGDSHWPAGSNYDFSDGRNRIQVLVGLQPGTKFAAGERRIAKIHIAVSPTASGETDIRFEQFIGPYDERNARYFSVDPNSPAMTQKLADVNGFPQSCVWKDGKVGFAVCDIHPTPSSLHFDQNGGYGEFAISATTGCTWSVEANDDWTTVTSHSSGSGSTLAGQPVTFVVGRNEGYTARTTTFTIVGGTAFTVLQDGAPNPFVPLDGWTFGDLPGVFAQPGHSPASPSPAGTTVLSLLTNNNTNTFGFWELFPYSLPSVSGTDYLYELGVNVKSNIAQATLIPGIRFRTSTADYQQTDALIATSVDNGSYSPTLAGKNYLQYFTLPAGQSQFRLDFDVLGFDSSDSAQSQLDFSAVQVRGIRYTSLLDEITEASYDFAGATNGWTAGPTSAVGNLLPASFRVTARGLAITSGSSQEPAAAVFGFWSKQTDLQMQANRIYKLSFTLSSDLDQAHLDRTPAFRMRLNDNSFKASAYSNFESVNAGSRMPYLGHNETYDLWFRCPAEVDGNQIIGSFDYLFVPGTNTDPLASLTLEKLTVKSYRIP